MYSWMSEKLEMRSGGISGNGIFANSDIKKDERLIVFGGYIMTVGQELSLPKKISDYAHQIDDDLVIGINHEKDIQIVDHLNHSCDPNAGFKGQIVLVAMRDIIKNEEVTFDYAMTLAEIEEDVYRIECKCRLSICRKIITDSDWKIHELQQKYAGYFQYYIEKKIQRKNAKIL